MRHFFGGWALGTLVYGTALLKHGVNGTKAIDCYLWAGIVIGPLCGIAACGLWP